MLADASWIWLNEKTHPQLQSSPYTYYCEKDDFDGYCAVEISRAYRFMKTAVSLKIDVCADTVYRLWINGMFTGSGPVYSGGDNSSVLRAGKRYFSTYKLQSDPETLSIRAIVRKNPTIMAESSAGVGGFILSCEITYDDGTVESVNTDDKWDIRLLNSRISDAETDFTRPQAEWEKAQIVPYPVDLFKSPIPNLSEEQIFPQNREMMICPPYSSARFCVDFDRIYAAYAIFSCDGEDYTVLCGASECEDEPYETEKITAKGKVEYFSIQYKSYGKIIFDVINRGSTPVKIYDVSLLFRHYPVSRRGTFMCSDAELNSIYRLCVDTLDICRQDLHLDSPRHREPLGCVGDYYIEALTEYFVYGDKALTGFDITRIGDYLLANDGKMFHTSYSLIWIMMIYDYYTYTGDDSIFAETEQAMLKLLQKFEEYVGPLGVIEKAPNYMFVDWVNIDGFDLHHPPKALGQAVLTAFYYRALDITSKIYALRSNNKLRSRFRLAADAVKKGFNDCFYDEKRGLYFAGMGTKETSPVGKWLPENVRKRYFTRHVNALAVLFGLADGKDAKTIAVRVASDKTLGDVQPYFMHYVLDVVYKYGLFEKYGLKLIRRWKTLVDECPKGLGECWPGFDGDHSHAWGCTPAYQLTRAVLGLEIVGAGFSEIKLKPELYGLESAEIYLPTPYGDIECILSRGNKPKIKVPDGISYTLL